MTPETKNRITQLFEKQNILAQDREFWLSRLEQATDVAADDIVKMFEQFPAHIGWFRMMQEKKEIALALDDNTAWNNIVEEEKQYFASAVAGS